ncbi:MAG: hypothetical protein IJ258_05210 [Methanobrevibacter sp.]|uniref:hypothetical protein n=1 Tax=Methanobrevibacter sp. TaxID=66852 RepID=UPI0025F15184|nr:hypothetical protein [Methanobrevibacter sp.]MBQ8017488.1 hypothetical protein [Methanobrevibacter sp.]
MTVYEDFVSDYNNLNLTAHDVRRIHGLNGREYSHMCNQARNNGDIPDVRHMNSTNAKFYRQTRDGKFTVQKQTAGIYQHVGKFESEEDAKYIAALCLSNDWVISPEIRFEINRLKVKPKNYSFVNGHYIIQKFIDGRNKVFASIPADKVSEDTVREIVDRFRCMGWNEECKTRILEEFDIT